MANILRAAGFRGFTELLLELGANPAEIYAQTGLNETHLTNPDNIIPSRQIVRAMNLAAEKTGQADFGLRLGLRNSIDFIGPAGLLAKQSETLGEALQALSRYISLHNQSSQIAMSQYGKKCLLTYDDVTPGMNSNPHLCDRSLTVGVNFFRSFLGRAWTPSAMFFKHRKPADSSLYEKTFACPLFFDSDVYAIEFEAEALTARSSQTDPAMRQFFLNYLEELKRQNLGGLPELVENLIRSLLSTGCDQEVIAEVLDMHPRTLQKRLKAEGVCFGDLLNNVRAEMATQYLLESDISLTDLASMLGYSELSAFSRFFSGHFGCSPRNYRKANRADCG
ncbi:AraC family transcriptional regulator [Spongiibacter sp. KMU-158]|uniref:AraC family transcriptional regulator n=1 Tax=Spongiibacter pelagi TaxID=2760804 RepID=A0A927C373_9GAMM|nr:AraC family transcriptional regulator [Spongiibacter pelagi]MBD2858791.1 AraC family transcriptional regulator [Spongiibacter pelagi]